jgi:hypothetical protein
MAPSTSSLKVDSEGERMANVLDSRELMPGWQAAVYFADGSLYGQANSFTVEADITSSDEQPLGVFWTIGVPQSATGTLTIGELVVNDYIPRTILEGLRNNVVPAMRFVVERWKANGTRSTLVIDDCIPDGTLTLASAESGSTMTRENTWKIGVCPDPSGLFD